MTAHLILAAAAQAQDAIVLPVVPTEGVSPVVQWLMGVASVVLSISIPIAVAYVRQHLLLRNDATRAGMINTAIERAAASTVSQINTGTPAPTALAQGVAYVKQSYPDAIAATDQATDEHLAESIQAEVARLAALAGKPPPVAGIPPAPTPVAVVTAPAGQTGTKPGS
jgi:hypothetical protein